MVLAKPWYHTAIICAKEKKILTRLKIIKKLKLCTLQFQVATTFNQRWSRGNNLRGQGQGLEKNPRPRTGISRTDPLEAKTKDRVHNFLNYGQQIFIIF